MNKLEIFNSISGFIDFRKKNLSNKTIGFVPTMGALHPGHASLISQSRKENDVTVVSIYVNPTQFNNSEDLKKYPKTWEQDLTISEKSGAQIILAPQYEEIYKDNYRYKMTENSFSKILCGANRPGHFDGVLTVVLKLLQIVQPTRSYFGEKDYQQLLLIKDMISSFFLDTQLVPCPTIREIDGLAMSSRNVRLSPQGREKAPLLYQYLKNSKTTEEVKSNLAKAKIEFEYVEEHFERRFLAALIDNVRLIDNVKI